MPSAATLKSPQQHQSYSANQLLSSTDVQVFSLVRSALAIAALVVIWVDAEEPKRWVTLTYASLACYALYSLGVVYAAHRQQWLRPFRVLYWADVVFAGYLVCLTQGTFSAYSFFFFFSIMAAAFTGGFREGLRVTAASAVLFLLAAAAVSTEAMIVDLDRTLIRPLSLLGLGFLISYWGEFEIRLKRKLALLNELTGSFSTRADCGRAIETNVSRLCSLYDADACILAVRGEHPQTGFFFRCEKHGSVHRFNRGDELPENTLRQLLLLGEAAGKYARGHFQAIRSSTEQRSTVRTGAGASEYAQRNDRHAQAVANLLEAETFLTVPYSQSDGTKGRLFLIWRTRRRFDSSDVEFLRQWSAALATAVLNVTLHEQLVKEAAELERLITSRDLHDEVVQPYVALQLALEGLAREIPAELRAAHKLRDIIKMTESTVADVRRVAVDPRTGSSSTSTSLRKAFKLQIERYKRHFGIDIHVRCADAPRLPRNLALAAFRIVSEALSNVLRHTASRRGFVSLRIVGPNLEVEIRNEIAGGAGPAPFTPRSISGRVQENRGTLTVVPMEDGHTVVRAVLPLSAAV